MLYSARENAFYLENEPDDENPRAIPSDAKDVPDELYQLMMAPGNKRVAPGDNGLPCLVDYDISADDILSMRRDAYRRESDHLKIEAEYDAASSGGDPDYTAWFAKVAEIKERYPLKDQK